NRKRATSSWRLCRERMSFNDTDTGGCADTNTTDCINADVKKEM
ncbi:MAG: hypothetical protein ACI8RD_004891, partial [Bacillariaceae sp.]